MATKGKGIIDKLHAAKLIHKETLTKEQKATLETLTDEEVHALISVKKKLKKVKDGANSRMHVDFF